MSTPAANETASPASSAAAGTFEDQTPRSESTAGEWIVVEGIGQMTKKVREKKKVIMEPERKMGPDLEDPRYLGKGPCGKKHLEFESGGNGYGKWKTCAKCALRLEYVPVEGASSEHTKKHNPANITAALEWLMEIGLWNEVDAQQVLAMINIVVSLRHVSGQPLPLTKEAVLKRLREKPPENASGSRPRLERKTDMHS
jgi:hypothetical protein